MLTSDKRKRLDRGMTSNLQRALLESAIQNLQETDRGRRILAAYKPLTRLLAGADTFNLAAFKSLASIQAGGEINGSIIDAFDAIKD